MVRQQDRSRLESRVIGAKVNRMTGRISRFSGAGMRRIRIRHDCGSCKGKSRPNPDLSIAFLADSRHKTVMIGFLRHRLAGISLLIVLATALVMTGFAHHLPKADDMARAAYVLAGGAVSYTHLTLPTNREV